MAETAVSFIWFTYDITSRFKLRYLPCDATFVYIQQSGQIILNNARKFAYLLNVYIMLV